MTLSESKMISIDKFRTVIEHTPLVSIDLIVETEGQYLLGKRKNKPAKGYYFTLGGRILKDERLCDAAMRITAKETGYCHTLDDLVFQGVYEHHYPDSFVDEHISTHYVILAYRLHLSDIANLPDCEHSEYQLFTKSELLDDPNVHPYVKDYFKGNK